MPNKAEILATLTQIANDAILLAIAWHLVAGLAMVALFLGFKPTRRLVTVALSVPIATVGVASFTFGNPFNGAIFAVSALSLGVLAWRTPLAPLERESGPMAFWGLGLITFGWVYPHFLNDQPWFAYAYAAPLGLLPCPTLAFIMGVTLLYRGLVGGAWRVTLGVLGTFYAVFGVARLGVRLDVLLALGPIGLLVQVWLARRTSVARHASA
jgi:hypothetical protein